MIGTALRSHINALWLAFGLALSSCGASGPAVDGYKLVATYPHDPSAYTQGLLFANGKLYESTGREFQSSIRRVDLETGAVEETVKLPSNLFGEGLALHGSELFQLTWTSGAVHVFDLETFKVLRNFRIEGEGWGITSDGTNLIMSDGSDVLSVRDPKDFSEVRRIRVTSNGKPLQFINELEYVNGEIWANLWKRFEIARIDPKTGEVLGLIDLSGIFDNSDIPDEDAVLNGIAYDAKNDRIFVTGKLWPSVFEIERVPN